MVKIKTAIRPRALKFLLAALVIFLLIDALAKFAIIDFTSIISSLLVPTVAGLFILLDVGIEQAIRGKRAKLDVLDWFLVLFAGLVLLGVVLSLLGMTFAFLTTIQGLANLFLGLVVIVSIFKK